MQTKIPMTFRIESKYFDAQTGELFDEMSSCAKGCMLLSGGETRLLYREKDEQSETLTDISFKEKDKLILKKSGAAKYELHFAIGKKYEFLYYAPPLSFDAEVVTHTLKNSVCLAGGSVTVEYTMNMGGHRQKVSISINAEAN